MTIIEIRNKVFTELDSRGLSDPSRRKRALNHVLEYIQKSQYNLNGKVILPKNKNSFKNNYEISKGKKLNKAESSVINEMYKQYEF